MLKQKHIILGFGFLACLVPLYWAKAEADKMRDNVRTLQTEIAKEKKTIRTLKAELSWLSNYSRIEKTALNDLAMVAADGEKYIKPEELDIIAPKTLTPEQKFEQSKAENGGQIETNQ